jgi:hypothetical protein
MKKLLLLLFITIFPTAAFALPDGVINTMDWLTRTIFQCWTCDAFDPLFVVISDVGAKTYDVMMNAAMLIMSIFIIFYVIYLVLIKLKETDKDPLYMNRLVKPVLIPALIITVFAAAGTVIPRAISTGILEPVAAMTTAMAKTALTPTEEAMEKAKVVDYKPKEMNSDGFYTPELKNSIVEILKTTTYGFQNFILFGASIITNTLTFDNFSIFVDGKFTLSKIIGSILLILMGGTILVFFIGLMLKFLFYFIDVGIGLAMFAFLFPLMLAAFIMKNADVPDWVKNASKMSEKFFKQCTTSIIALGSMTIVYVIIVALITGFINGNPDQNMMQMIMNGDFANIKYSSPEILQTIPGFLVMIIVVGWIYSKIDTITGEIKNALQLNSAEQKEADKFEESEMTHKQTAHLVKMGVKRGIQLKNFIKNPTGKKE